MIRTAAALTRSQKLEAMTPEERYAFWRGELSRCIRCNACRNVCPGVLVRKVRV